MDEKFIEKLSIMRRNANNTQLGNQFNVFTALHHPYDERRLHSRFIAYLLSPHSSHGRGTLFLEKLIDILGISDFELKGSRVIPNENNKSEWNDLDIYIKNDSRQAIIIENKIFAPDSNKISPRGVVVPQLLGYYDKARRDLGLDESLALTNIRLVYLTPTRRKPSYYNFFNQRGIHPILIDYKDEVPRLLGECLKVLEESYLKDTISQYENLLFSITNNVHLALTLKTLIGDNIQSAFELSNNSGKRYVQEFQFLTEQFKHVKWHTIHEFWVELCSRILSELYVNANGPTDEEITSVAHRNTRKALALNFSIDNRVFYIANDVRGFTWGVFEDGVPKLSIFSFQHSAAIVFGDFSSQFTFNMINDAERRKVIDCIVKEVVSEVAPD